MSLEVRNNTGENEAARRRGQLPGQQPGSVTVGAGRGTPPPQVTATVNVIQNVQSQAMYNQAPPVVYSQIEVMSGAGTPPAVYGSSTSTGVAMPVFGYGAPVVPNASSGFYGVYPQGMLPPGMAPVAHAPGGGAARVVTSENEANMRRAGMTSKTVVNPQAPQVVVESRVVTSSNEADLRRAGLTSKTVNQTPTGY